MAGPPSLVDRSGWIALRVCLVVLGVVVATWLVIQLAPVLLLVFVALVLAAGVLGPSEWLESRGLPRIVAVPAIYAGLTVVLGVVLVVVMPPLVGQLTELIASVPEVAGTLADRIGAALARVGLEVDLQDVVGALGAGLGDAGAVVAGLPIAIAGVVISLLTVVFVSLLALLERARARAWVSQFVGRDDRAMLLDLAGKAAERLGAYIRGQLLIMTVTGTGSWLALTVLGVPFAVPLGVLAFLTEAVPLAGPIVSGAVMVAVALLESPAQAAGTLLLVLALQQFEGLVLIPLVQGRVISISPAVALIGVLAGTTLGGIPGALVAIPVIAVAMVVIEEVVVPWRRRAIREGS